jgi:hypothetical protein
VTVNLETETITLSGDCGVEEVEALVTYLESRPELSVDISAARAIHTALWQALMMFRPKVIGNPLPSVMTDKLGATLEIYLNQTRV